LRRALKYLAALAGGLLLVGVVGFAGVLYIFHSYGRGLPDYRQLADYEPPIVTRIHAGDGRLLAEYATEKRVFVPVEAMPKRLIQAFLSAEDKSFYSHPGIDLPSVASAMVINAQRWWQGRRPVGASTITQQVAKNFLLSNELSLTRKIKEAILAFRIEQAFTKDEILELYLNEIYLGIGSYGVAAAGLNYFDKSLDELTTGEAAFLAGLPKAPSHYHPRRDHDAAKGRRDWVIGRMLEDRVISREEAERARAEPLVMRERAPTDVFEADYFTEEVRRELIARYGERALYEGGLSVRTTLEPELQNFAENALRQGLVAYDQRHGWRGPEDQLEVTDGWQGALAELASTRAPIEGWQLALVLEAGTEAARIGLADGSEAELPLAGLDWARAVLEGGGFGGEITAADQVVQPGDVVWVERVDGEAGDGSAAPAAFALRQPPAVDGALVALNPHTGRVLAMAGGFSYERSQFNRATQALRQPGSAFKPFVYLAALENGFTPSSIVLDAPLVIEQGGNLGKWKPANYSGRFYGPSTLRLGVEKSRNLMTVRLAQAVGMQEVLDVAERFEIARGMSTNLASALGAGEVNLLHLTTAYAMLVNGGKRIDPALIERIQANDGATVARRDERPCAHCQGVAWQDQPTPELVDPREQVVDPAHAYQIVNILQGVIERGTGVRAQAIGKPVAGKTGTSDDVRDAWFMGFSPDLAVGVFVGFDQPKSLGEREQGASAALPIFVDFMGAALEDQPAIPFRVPPGVRLVRVDAESGLLPGPATHEVILEAFIPGSEPTRSGSAGGGNGIDGGFGPSVGANGRRGGGPRMPNAGGLY
jgi:penicillin-binding protein 1A